LEDEAVPSPGLRIASRELGQARPRCTAPSLTERRAEVVCRTGCAQGGNGRVGAGTGATQEVSSINPLADAIAFGVHLIAHPRTPASFKHRPRQSSVIQAVPSHPKPAQEHSLQLGPGDADASVPAFYKRSVASRSVISEHLQKSARTATTGDCGRAHGGLSRSHATATMPPSIVRI
jgi:hypothetical protein